MKELGDKAESIYEKDTCWGNMQLETTQKRKPGCESTRTNQWRKGRVNPEEWDEVKLKLKLLRFRVLICVHANTPENVYIRKPFTYTGCVILYGKHKEQQWFIDGSNVWPS